MSVSDFADDDSAAEVIEPQRRTRRTNAQILEDQNKEQAEKAAAARLKKTPAKKAGVSTRRPRRTKAEIAAEEAAYEALVQREAKERAAAKPLPKGKRKSVTIHFKEDGKTFNDKVWYRGEELTIVEGTHEWDLAHNRFGEFIFNETEDEQYEKYGRVLYAEGPWPGRPYEFKLQIDSPLYDSDNKLIDTQLTDQEIRLLQKVNQQRGLA